MNEKCANYATGNKSFYFSLLPVTEIAHFCNALAFRLAPLTDNFGMQFGTAASKLGTTPQDHIRNLSSK